MYNIRRIFVHFIKKKKKICFPFKWNVRRFFINRFFLSKWAISTGFDVSFKNRSDNLNLKCDNDV